MAVHSVSVSFPVSVFTVKSWMWIYFYMLIWTSCYNTSVAGQHQVIGPQDVLVKVGDDVILPCHIEPTVNMARKTVEWTRPDLEPYIIHLLQDGHYKHGQELNPLYKGRTSLFPEEVANGNMSLKLSRVMLSDEGKYKCNAPQLNCYTLIQLVVVSQPVISSAGPTDGGLSLSCDSGCWYPESEMSWLDSDGTLLPAGPSVTDRRSKHCHVVQRNVTVRLPGHVTCRVHLPRFNHTVDEQRYISESDFPTEGGSTGAVIAGISAVIIIILVAAGLGYLYWKKKHPGMDFIDPFLGIATKLYALCEEVKANKKRCTRLKDRVKGLEQVLRAIQGKGDQISPDSKMHTTLVELILTLESAGVVVKKYNADSKTLFKRFWNTFNYGDEFESLNGRLNDAFQVLSLNLSQVEMDHKLFDAASQQEQDEADKKEDCAEIQKMLQHMMDQLDQHKGTVEEKLEAMSLIPDAKADLKQMIEMLQKSEIIPEGIRQINPEDLTFDIPKKPIMNTDILEVYKGEYKKYPVAIKRYLCTPQTTIPSEVRNIFNKEIDTMMRYESPHILRMFGVCFQGDDEYEISLSLPAGLIVMEYCEKGSLREVLDNSKRKLPWDRKARMCLDAAQGIYILHQSEQKPRVHGSITSDNFMVAEGYRVKLGGFELAQTETSLRGSPEGPKKGSLRYRSPELLQIVNHPYCKICEIYSLGMVLWEIATRMKPLDDCTTDHNILKRVCEEKRVLEPLPEDCPKKLGQLINACRGYDALLRPTAGVLVDKLRQVVEQLEEE